MIFRLNIPMINGAITISVMNPAKVQRKTERHFDVLTLVVIAAKATTNGRPGKIGQAIISRTTNSTKSLSIGSYMRPGFPSLTEFDGLLIAPSLHC